MKSQFKEAALPNNGLSMTKHLNTFWLQWWEMNVRSEIQGLVIDM